MPAGSSSQTSPELSQSCPAQTLCPQGLRPSAACRRHAEKRKRKYKAYGCGYSNAHHAISRKLGHPLVLHLTHHNIMLFEKNQRMDLPSSSATATSPLFTSMWPLCTLPSWSTTAKSAWYSVS